MKEHRVNRPGFSGEVFLDSDVAAVSSAVNPRVKLTSEKNARLAS